MKEEDLKEEPKKEVVQKVEPQKAEVLVKDQEAVEETVVEKQYHVIKKGENLYRISLRYGLSVDELCGINGIKSQDVVQAGQKLLISH
jgi:LysM repeat protein